MRYPIYSHFNVLSLDDDDATDFFGLGISISTIAFVSVYLFEFSCYLHGGIGSNFVMRVLSLCLLVLLPTRNCLEHRGSVLSLPVEDGLFPEQACLPTEMERYPSACCSSIVGALHRPQTGFAYAAST